MDYFKCAVDQMAKDNRSDDIRCEILGHLSEDFDDGDEMRQWFKDLEYGGCASGVATDMIYYTQTHRFFDDNYDEIDNLRHEWEEFSEPIKVEGDLKNFFAWFAYEVVARDLLLELEELADELEDEEEDEDNF